MSTCDKPYTSRDKWIASITLGLLFLLLSSPIAFSFTNNFTDRIGFSLSDGSGCPNVNGLLIHALVFMVILRIMINRTGENKCEKPFTSKDKWIVAIIGGMMFILLASPFLYSTTNTITNIVKFNTSDNGCPNTYGLTLHSALFILITRLLMR